MEIEVNKVYEDVRKEGPNQGVITTFIRLGTGRSYTTLEELVTDLYPNIKTSWICFCGEDTTRIGIGELVKALKSMHWSVEIIYDGKYRDPGWFNSVDLWTVDYVPDSKFAIARLRPKDCLRFKVPDIVRPERLIDSMNSVGVSSALRIVSLREGLDLNSPDIFSLLYRQERLRICRRQE